MNQKTLLFVASLAFAAVTACSNSGGSDGGSTTGGASSSGGSTGHASSSGSSSGSSTGHVTSSSSSGGSNSSSGSGTSGASSGSTGGTTGASSSGGSTGGTTGFPTPPTLGSAIDRMGRPAVNTALTDPLGDLLSATITNALTDGGLTEGQAKDQYNATPEFDDGGNQLWPAFGPQFAKSLAIYDALDGTCGNQLFASYTDAGVPTSPAAYGTLAGALTDDELYVDTTQTTCSTYLAVEANFAQLAGSPFADCGGRTPNENVIDETYSLLAAGVPAGVTNGITANPNGTATTTFPYLLPPL